MTASSATQDFWHPPIDETVLHIATECMLSFPKDTTPTLTIAIPTFRRPGLLSETMRSIVEQTDLTAVRVIVLDNDPQSLGHADLLEAVPTIKDLDFCYYRNIDNVGLFGNWNACIAASRSEWVSVLNDDDLLDPDFVAEMRSVLSANPRIDALVCSMREFDARGNGATLDRSHSLRERVKNIMRFGFKDRMRIRPKHLFFRNVAGSSLGLISRRTVLIEAGGYQRSEYPAADHMLNLRLAMRFNFVKLRKVLTSVRLQDENVSANRDVLIALLRQTSEIQRILGSHVPRWWVFLIGPFFSEQLKEWNARWKTDIGFAEMSQVVGRPIPERTGPFVRGMRFCLGVV